MEPCPAATGPTFSNTKPTETGVHFEGYSMYSSACAQQMYASFFLKDETIRKDDELFQSLALPDENKSIGPSISSLSRTS